MFVLSGPNGFLCYYDTDNIEEEGKTVLFFSEDEARALMEEVCQKTGNSAMFEEVLVVDVGTAADIANRINVSELCIRSDGEVVRRGEVR